MHVRSRNIAVVVGAPGAIVCTDPPVSINLNMKPRGVAMGFDSKYVKVTLEKREIPDDEPVVVLRGRDKLVPDVLDDYIDLALLAGSPQEHINLVRQTQEQIRTWQEKNPDRVRTPDSHFHFHGVEANDGMQ